MLYSFFGAEWVEVICKFKKIDYLCLALCAFSYREYASVHNVELMRTEERLNI